MKKRMQLTIGPKTQKVLTAVARQNNKLTGLNHTSVDVATAALNIGLITVARNTLPDIIVPASIRD
jgi:hypothetical protein